MFFVHRIYEICDLFILQGEMPLDLTKQKKSSYIMTQLEYPLSLNQGRE